jgi:Na+/melibiose symporter-like transporter
MRNRILENFAAAVALVALFVAMDSKRSSSLIWAIVSFLACIVAVALFLWRTVSSRRRD